MYLDGCNELTDKLKKKFVIQKFLKELHLVRMEPLVAVGISAVVLVRLTQIAQVASLLLVALAVGVRIHQLVQVKYHKFEGT